MNGERVGDWRIRSQGRHEFGYDPAWIESPGARPISLSLSLAPVGHVYTGPIVEAWFDNLLPDNADIRMRIRRRFSAASLSPFDLLAQIGRDCAGAIQLLPEGEEPGNVQRIDARPLDEAGVEAILRGVTTAGPGMPDELDTFRISIAGAQEKTALLRQDGAWYEPTGATPTTHILKLPLGRIGTMGVDMSLSLENEWLCARIASALGFEVAPCDLATFGETRALIVERFDRRLSSDRNWIVRLPQEDFCQATGNPPFRKYESDGGPGIPQIMSILLGSRDPFTDRRTFLLSQLLFWLLAAPDGHAKNYSVFIEPGGRYRLTPLYDIMSAYPVMGYRADRIAHEKLRMAMAVTGRNRHYEWRKISLRHWRHTASTCGMGREIDGLITELIERIPAALEAVSCGLPRDFPDSVAGPITNGIRDAAARMREEMTADS